MHCRRGRDETRNIWVRCCRDEDCAEGKHRKVLNSSRSPKNASLSDGVSRENTMLSWGGRLVRSVDKEAGHAGGVYGNDRVRLPAIE